MLHILAELAFASGLLVAVIAVIHTITKGE